MSFSLSDLIRLNVTWGNPDSVCQRQTPPDLEGAVVPENDATLHVVGLPRECVTASAWSARWSSPVSPAGWEITKENYYHARHRGHRLRTGGYCSARGAWRVARGAWRVARVLCDRMPSTALIDELLDERLAQRVGSLAGLVKQLVN